MNRLLNGKLKVQPARLGVNGGCLVLLGDDRGHCWDVEELLIGDSSWEDVVDAEDGEKEGSPAQSRLVYIPSRRRSARQHQAGGVQTPYRRRITLDLFPRRACA
jgi:hypothetical protein